MIKNKRSDLIFGLLLILFLISLLFGCGTERNTRPNHEERGTYEERETDEEETTEEIVTEETIIVEVATEETIEETTENLVEESDETETDTSESEPRESDIQELEVTESEETSADSFEVTATLQGINRICGLTAEVETDITACHVDTINSHNPYDVIYDFGEEYQAYVDACDWSLVFDADYYMDTFPMLALQYHYDEDLLLEHFQTIGVHEGRQGSANFNVKAYMVNGKRATFDTFSGNLEGYYFYYMLNYDSEKNVNTTSLSSGNPVASMYKFRPTALQAAELEGVNEYREAVNSDALTLHAEVCALANYRAYLNAHDGWKAHDWALEYTDTLMNYGRIIGGDGCVSENTCTFSTGRKHGYVCVEHYANSEAHYNAMVNNKFTYMGVSNMYNGEYSSSQFDVFVKNAYSY